MGGTECAAKRIGNGRSVPLEIEPEMKPLEEDRVLPLVDPTGLVIGKSSRPINQSLNHSVTQSLSHSITQSLNHSVTQSLNTQYSILNTQSLSASPDSTISDVDG
ncbi:hypothetical protein GJ744_009220 [Endocarpon pusillum]|uniref:Uncharacterized protein n=1 Tax=Endocarpon pusillum TaxID=364733 RepID=A0A8H7AK91_9EURO|nr:hypothetical protein GJ744_009220 [Endocarpon pusillum]